MFPIQIVHFRRPTRKSLLQRHPRPIPNAHLMPPPNNENHHKVSEVAWRGVVREWWHLFGHETVFSIYYARL